MITRGKNEAIQATLYALISRVILVIISFGSAKFLTASQFGTLTVVLVALSGITSISALGLGTVNNSVASSNEATPQQARAMFTASLLLSILMSILASLVFFPLIYQVLGEQYTIITLLLILILTSTCITINGVFEGINYGYAQYKNMLKPVALVLATLVLFGPTILERLDLEGALLLAILHRLFVVLSLGFLVFLYTPIRFSLKELSQEIAFVKAKAVNMSLPISMSGVIAAPATAIAVGVLQKNAPIEETAVFGLLYQVFLIACFVPGALTQFTVSRLGNKLNNTHLILKQTFKYCIVFGLIMAVFIQFTPFIISYFLTEAPVQQTDALILSIAVCFYITSTAFSGYFNGTQNSWPVFYSQIGFVLPVLLSTFLFAAKYGATSIITGFAIGSVIQLSIYSTIYTYYRKL